MTSPTPDRPGALNWALILGLGVIWGTAFMGVSTALEGYGVWTVTAGRTVLGGLALMLTGAAMGQGLTGIRGARAWGFTVLIGILAVAMPFSLLSWGLSHVSSAFAGVAMGAVPLLVLPLVALFSPEEGIGPRRIMGVALGFAGLVLLVGDGAFDSTGRDAEWLGRLACVGAAGCYAIGSVLTRRAPAMPPVSFATATLLVAAAVMLPIALLIDGVPTDFPARPTLSLLYVALLPTGLAAIIRIRVITTAGSLFMSMVSYMVPVWAVIFGITLMGETLPPTLFWALGVILAGILLSQWRNLFGPR
ncbi:DMT family transporter [Rhodophyticola sp. CCM32]|uniref:DMT family transporter n=1 Tax=Rhodophyticola sp. CCM32 TaxID=2916397 RepID=UPI00107F7B58|nr:DMT family transporter [Rhodophyticola sp. CCM32]QBY01619.1 DMT family transporter [Rhodophyticola sp. CCM32]